MDSRSGGSCLGSFATLLTVVFITLKLTDYIDWSWWWVLSPIWISIGISIAIIVLFVLIALAVDKYGES